MGAALRGAPQAAHKDLIQCARPGRDGPPVARGRVWALVTNARPLRVYVFDGGVVPFGAPPAALDADRDTAAEPGSAGHAGAPAPAANAGADLIVNLWRLDRSQARAPVLPSPYRGTCMRRALGTFAGVSRVKAYWCGLVTIRLLSCQACTAVRFCERVRPAGGRLCGVAHEAQRLTGDALCTQARTWSVADLRTHLANATGSAAAFDGLWAAMQRSLGALGLRAPARTAR